MELFESPLLAEAIADRGYFVMDNVLPTPLVDALIEDCLDAFEKDEFHQAGIGAGEAHMVIRTIRNNAIQWWDPAAPTQAQTGYNDFLEQLRVHLNRGLYLGLHTFETQYAVYVPGGFYRKHIDRFQERDNRQMSLTFYLNRDWTEAEGGCLRLYDKTTGPLDVQPRFNRMVIFPSSDLEHEVLLSHRQRLSITTWFKNRAWPLV